MGFTLDPKLKSAPQLQSSFCNPASNALCARRLWSTIRRPAAASNGRVTWNAALAVLQQAGVEADLVPTRSPEHAIEETRRSIDSGCDTIFACGGDGTIHNLIQVLANSPAALAVLPLGTANALAHDLGLPLKVVAAAKAVAGVHPAPCRSWSREIFGSSRQSRHPLFCGRSRSRRRRSPVLQTSHGNQAAHGNGGLLCQGLASLVQLSHDPLCCRATPSRSRRPLSTRKSRS